MLRAGIGSKSAYLLTTTGRKSGQHRTTAVILVETGGERWLVSPYGTVGWVHNVRATPKCRFGAARGASSYGPRRSTRRPPDPSCSVTCAMRA
jgi:deazaflavin-dependent oxidoreductase (nitroreductase family)